MINLNKQNGADIILYKVANFVLDKFEKDIIGAEFGIAWAGGIEEIGKIWKDKGIIYGFDTFEGLPKEESLRDKDCNYSLDSFGATCMDDWYKSFGYDCLTLEYIQSELDKQGLNNVKLVKGLINENSNIDYIPYLNYVLLDLDIPICMKNVYKLVKDKIVKGGYLCLHDVVPKGHINGLNEWYQEILKTKEYEIIMEVSESYLTVLRKK